jgi:hypothetical protein
VVIAGEARQQHIAEARLQHCGIEVEADRKAWVDKG